MEIGYLICLSICITRHGDDLGLIWFLGVISTLALPTNMRLQDTAWCWKFGNKKILSWYLPNCTWRILLTYFVKLNCRWRVNFDVGNWIRFWKKLWGSPTMYKDKVILWHVLNHGYFHQKRAMIWRVHNGICPCCNLQPKTIEHLFFGCKNLKCRWATIAILLSRNSLAQVFYHGSLWSIIHARVMRARRSPVWLLVIVEMV